MLTLRQQAASFNKWLIKREPRNSSPRYTDQELVGYARAMLSNTSWSVSGEELVKELRSMWSEKGRATRADNVTKKSRAAALAADRARQMQLFEDRP